METQEVISLVNNMVSRSSSTCRSLKDKDYTFSHSVTLEDGRGVRVFFHHSPCVEQHPRRVPLFMERVDPAIYQLAKAASYTIITKGVIDYLFL